MDEKAKHTLNSAARFAIVYCALVILAGLCTALAHTFVERPDPANELPVEILYFESILGFRCANPFFEVTKAKLDGSAPVRRFAAGLKRHVLPTLRKEGEYAVRYQGGIYKAGGWPFVSRPICHPITIMDTSGDDYRELRLGPDATTPIQIWGLVGNWGFYLLVLIVTYAAVRRMWAWCFPTWKRSDGFPVVFDQDVHID